MLKKSRSQQQRSAFEPLLTDFINRDHELVLLSEKIDWKYFEKEFAVYYSDLGRSSMPIRFSVGSLLLKRLYNLGDESLAKAWVMNPYMQYFTGEAHFRHNFPCDPSDFVHFRKRIGVKGVEKIFGYTVSLHGQEARSKQMMSDTSVQENNTAFPTDAKMAKRIIDKCNKVAKQEGIKQRQTYKRVSKQLLRDTYNASHVKRKKKARKSSKKLKTIAKRLLRELDRKLSEHQLEQHKEQLELYWKVIDQKREDKDKIYSLHKPFTSCIAKGKAHKKYEFGNKVGIMTTMGKRIIITAVNAYKGNPHDSKTIESLLEQSQHLHNHEPEELVYDRGGRGKTQIRNTLISTPKPPLKRDSPYQKRKKRKKFRRRAGIEPVIGHLKNSFRMGQNYLSGSDSPKINALLAASGWNLKKMMEVLVENIFMHIINALVYSSLYFRKELIRNS